MNIGDSIDLGFNQFGRFTFLSLLSRLGFQIFLIVLTNLDLLHLCCERTESVGSLEIQDSIQRKQITLVDDDGVRLTFSLWGDQYLLANCFSVGSMLALDRSCIACLEPFNEISLEYGSETQLYMVPLLHHEEQQIDIQDQNCLKH